MIQLLIITHNKHVINDKAIQLAAATATPGWREFDLPK